MNFKRKVGLVMKRRYKKKRKSNYGYLVAIFAIALFYSKGYFSEISIEKITSLSVIMVLFLFLLLCLNKSIAVIKKKKRRRKYINSGIEIVDKMKGNEFEYFLKAHFEKQGYSVKLTKASNDYGADLLIENSKNTIAVQAKRYGKKVGIKAVQEIASSLSHYKASKGIVITNNYFTKNAIVLAETNNVDLWDRDKLIGIMRKNGLNETATKVIDNTVNEARCPECGNVLFQKKSKHGVFLGCSNYPKCSFTRNIN